MSYESHFYLADDIIYHLDGIIEKIEDPFIHSRYIGFIAISCATVYELAVKDIFCEFSEKKHKVLGCFAASYFNRINGRIKTQHLKDDYIEKFGDKYLKRFSKKLESNEYEFLTNHRISILSAYNNLLEWRNQFAHEGKIPNTVTYKEITKSYKNGKIVIECLAETMRY